MTEKPRCGARRRKTHQFCRQYPLQGATRCRLHGGGAQVLPPGDSARGGRPASHGLYSGRLVDEAARETYERCDLDSIDEEIRISCANLSLVMKRIEDNQSAIYISSTRIDPSGAKTISGVPAIVVAADYVDKIRKLKIARPSLKEQKEKSDHIDKLVEMAMRWTPEPENRVLGPLMSAAPQHFGNPYEVQPCQTSRSLPETLAEPAEREPSVDCIWEPPPDTGEP